jgi:hypothetical protein
MQTYDVYAAFEILKQYYITDSKQMVARWLREGRIKGFRTENRKEGWTIYEEDLYDFIDRERPGLRTLFLELKEIRKEYKEIRGEVARLHEEMNEIKINKPEKSKGILTLEEFNKAFSAVIAKEHPDIGTDQIQDIKQICEELYFSEGAFKTKLHNPDSNEFICPDTKESAKYFKPLLKRLIRRRIDSKN